MNATVAVRPKMQVASPWQWRDRFGNFYDPVNMTTTHLFYTLRMIWNHTMPLSARSNKYHQYSAFNKFYTDAYFKQAIRELASMLATRTDMKAKHRTELERMINWLAVHQLETAAPAAITEGSTNG